MTGISDDDADRIKNRGKPRPKGKIPYPPERAATLPELRGWVSDAAGLPAEVRIDSVLRAGREPDDPVTIVLSNQMSLRCPHQKWLQQARTLQAFLASESDGIAQPSYLSPAEVGDFYTVLCRLGTASSKADPIADLHEYLAMFVAICDKLIGSLRPDHRYVTIEAIRQRPLFDRNVALGMRNGKPEAEPVLLVDQVDDKRYVRASEWIAYLRFVLGWTVEVSGLAARMVELGSERIDSQAWNTDRSHKTHLVFYALPEGL